MHIDCGRSQLLVAPALLDKLTEDGIGGEQLGVDDAAVTAAVVKYYIGAFETLARRAGVRTVLMSRRVPAEPTPVPRWTAALTLPRPIPSPTTTQGVGDIADQEAAWAELGRDLPHFQWALDYLATHDHHQVRTADDA